MFPLSFHCALRIILTKISPHGPRSSYARRSGCLYGAKNAPKIIV